MALVPPSGTHANPDSYAFALAANTTLVSPTVVPAANAANAVLGINNGLPTTNPNAAYIVQYMNNASAGGLVAGHYQTFLYSPQVGGNNIGEIFDAYGNGNNDGIFKCNLGVPLDASRIGYTPATNGATPVVVNCPSVSADSVIQFAWVAGVLGGAAPPVVSAIVPGVSFSVTQGATIGAIYSYTVYG